MKKLHLLAITPLILGVAGGGIALQAVNNNDDTQISAAVTSNTSLFFNNDYSIKSSITPVVFDRPLTIEDQISTEHRVNKIYYGQNLVSELSVIKSGVGNAEEEYITLQNEVATRALVDEEGNSISYDAYYGNPFKSLTTLSNAQLNSYFDVTIVDNNYVLRANDLAYGLLTKNIINFYPALDFTLWDTPTYTTYIEDLTITLLEDGTPSTMTFNRIKKDRFGGAKEPVSAEFFTLDSIETLKPVTPKLTEEQSLELKTKLATFQEKISAGNFTETFSLFEGELVYSNYYALGGNPNSYLPGLMISDCPLYDANYGYTYISLLLTTDGYIQYAVSPEANYSGKMSNEVYPNMSEVIPDVSVISTDFFEYANGSYVFDISNFFYADVTFCSQILTALMGFADPAVSIIGAYLDNYSYTFNTLTFNFDSNGLLNGNLNYVYMNQAILDAEFSFSNVGTTVLENVESIKDAVNYFLYA